MIAGKRYFLCFSRTDFVRADVGASALVVLMVPFQKRSTTRLSVVVIPSAARNLPPGRRGQSRFLVALLLGMTGESPLAPRLSLQELSRSGFASEFPVLDDDTAP